MNYFKIKKSICSRLTTVFVGAVGVIAFSSFPILADDDAPGQQLANEALQTARDIAENNTVGFDVWVEIFNAAATQGKMDVALGSAEKYKSAPTLYGKMLESGANISALNKNGADSQKIFDLIEEHLRSNYSQRPEQAPDLAYNAAHVLAINSMERSDAASTVKFAKRISTGSVNATKRQDNLLASIAYRFIYRGEQLESVGKIADAISDRKTRYFVKMAAATQAQKIDMPLLADRIVPKNRQEILEEYKDVDEFVRRINGASEMYEIVRLVRMFKKNNLEQTRAQIRERLPAYLAVSEEYFNYRLVSEFVDAGMSENAVELGSSMKMPMACGAWSTSRDVFQPLFVMIDRQIRAGEIDKAAETALAIKDPVWHFQATSIVATAAHTAGMTELASKMFEAAHSAARDRLQSVDFSARGVVLDMYADLVFELGYENQIPKRLNDLPAGVIIDGIRQSLAARFLYRGEDEIAGALIKEIETKKVEYVGLHAIYYLSQKNEPEKALAVLDRYGVDKKQSIEPIAKAFFADGKTDEVFKLIRRLDGEPDEQGKLMWPLADLFLNSDDASLRQEFSKFAIDAIPPSSQTDFLLPKLGFFKETRERLKANSEASYLSAVFQVGANKFAENNAPVSEIYECLKQIDDQRRLQWCIEGVGKTVALHYEPADIRRLGDLIRKFPPAVQAVYWARVAQFRAKG